MIEIPEDCTKFQKGDFIAANSYMVRLTKFHKTTHDGEIWFYDRPDNNSQIALTYRIAPQYYSANLRLRNCTLEEAINTYPEYFI